MEQRKWGRQVKTTDEQWAAAGIAAEKAGISLSEWIRRAIDEKLGAKS